MTLAELAILGKPALLIPLPTAADDHQSKNAAAFADAGAALVLPQARHHRRAAGRGGDAICWAILAAARRWRRP